MLVAQSCPTLRHPMDCIPPRILQARILEWVAISFSRWSSQPRDQTRYHALQADSLPSEPPRKPLDHNKLWEILKEMGVPDQLTCLLRNLCMGEEATVRTGHGTMDWFQIEKWVCQGCILSPFLFNLYVEYIRQNVGLDKAQDGIKIARRNINNVRYAYDTTLMSESSS